MEELEALGCRLVSRGSNDASHNLAEGVSAARFFSTAQVARSRFEPDRAHVSRRLRKPRDDRCGWQYLIVVEQQRIVDSELERDLGLELHLCVGIERLGNERYGNERRGNERRDDHLHRLWFDRKLSGERQFDHHRWHALVHLDRRHLRCERLRRRRTEYALQPRRWTWLLLRRQLPSFDPPFHLCLRDRQR